MINLYSNEPLNVFLMSIPIGIIIGVLFDLFRLIRIIGFNNYAHTLVQDILFLILVSIIIFIFAYCVNGGVFRVYMFIGIGLSYFIYYNTLGRLFISVSDKLIRSIKKFFWFLYNNIVIRLYISLDKFYKKGKILIEKKIKQKYEKRIFAVMKG